MPAVPPHLPVLAAAQQPPPPPPPPHQPNDIGPPPEINFSQPPPGYPPVNFPPGLLRSLNILDLIYLISFIVVLVLSPL